MQPVYSHCSRPPKLRTFLAKVREHTTLREEQARGAAVAALESLRER